jgi:Tfp pilus assembly protein PilN
VISLNLLPQERKEAFHWRLCAKSEIFWGSKILGFLVIFCAPFLFINLYIQNRIAGLNDKISAFAQTEEMKQIEELGKSSQNINAALGKIDKISGERIYWTDVLTEIIKNIPSGIQIFSFEIAPVEAKGQTLAAKEGKFIIIGKAKTRDEVLALERNLKSSDNFKNIEFPLENLVKRSEVEFKFTGDFILDNFKAKKKAILAGD